MFSWLGLRKRPSPAVHAADAEPPVEASSTPAHPHVQSAPEPAPEQPTQDLPNSEDTRTELEALIAASRFGEADAIFARLPPDLAQEWYVQAGLSLARRRADHPETLKFATCLQTFSPSSPAAYSSASFALRALKRPTEAAEAAEAGLQHFPKAAGLLTEAALAAEAEDNTERAYSRWADVRAVQPKSSNGHVGAVQLSMRRQQPDVTRALLEEGLAAFPNDRRLRLAAARHAVRSQLWAEAATHWNVLTTAFPDDPALALEAATSSTGPRQGRNKRMAQVSAQLAGLQQRFPDFVPIYTAHVKALREAGNLDEAEAKGQLWRQLFPDDVDLAKACARVAEDRAAGASTSATSTSPNAG